MSRASLISYLLNEPRPATSRPHYPHTRYVKISEKTTKGNAFIQQKIAALEAEKAGLFEALRRTHPHEALRRNYRAQLVALERQIGFYLRYVHPGTVGVTGASRHGERQRRAQLHADALLAIHRAAGRSYQIIPPLKKLQYATNPYHSLDARIIPLELIP